MRLVVVCGTNRDGALSRLLAQEVAKAYETNDHQVDLLDMNELPADALSPIVYREPSSAVTDLVDRFLAADGAVFIVPEYNGSYPGVLKLFVDLLPYPAGLNSRPCAFIGLAAGKFQGLRAVEHFQQVAGYRNAYIYPRRIFIGDSYQKFADGRLTDDELVKRLAEQAEGFVAFIAANEREAKPAKTRGDGAG